MMVATKAGPRLLRRRSALLLPLVAATGGCAFIDDLFGTGSKPPLPGRRESILASRRGLDTAAADRRPVVVPPAEANGEWLQQGRTVTHPGGHLAAGNLQRAWRSSIGEGGGYRRKLSSTPLVAGGRVFVMDSDAQVSAFDLSNGGRVWRIDTQDKEDRSTNVGGGIALDAGVIYVTTGRADALALDADTGRIRWRKPLGSPARSAPTVAGGRLFASTIDDQLVALRTADGERAWTYQASSAATSVLGRPAPAVSEGLVVAGFGSGDLVAVREDSGTLAWSDSLASARGRNSLVDLSAVRGLPVIEAGRVYATSLGGLTVSLDLRSGRRLWERDSGGGETPWLAGGSLFFVTNDQVLACLSKDDGRVRWTADLPRYENPERQRDPINWSGPLLAGGRLLLAGSTEQLMSVDPRDGRVLGNDPLPGAGSVPPIAAGGTVLVLTDDATLTALR